MIWAEQRYHSGAMLRPWRYSDSLSGSRVWTHVHDQDGSSVRMLLTSLHGLWIAPLILGALRPDSSAGEPRNVSCGQLRTATLTRAPAETPIMAAQATRPSQSSDPDCIHLQATFHACRCKGCGLCIGHDTTPGKSEIRGKFMGLRNGPHLLHSAALVQVLRAKPQSY